MSVAEKLIQTFICQEKSSTWTCQHALGLLPPNGKPLAAIEFVLMKELITYQGLDSSWESVMRSASSICCLDRKRDASKAAFAEVDVEGAKGKTAVIHVRLNSTQLQYGAKELQQVEKSRSQLF